MRPRLLLLLLFPVALAVAAEPFDFGFTEGLAPIALGEGADKARDPERCGVCHQAQLADWKGSRHRVAHSNAIYQAGLMAEPKAFCVYCHSPLEGQADEVIANLDWYASQDPRTHGRAAPAALQPEPQAQHGISCAVCHFRDGEVLSASVSGNAPHASREAALMASGDFCAGCHQFRMPAFHDGELTLTDTPMQSTWSEWVAWTQAGGTSTCQDCHMPEGRHLFRGAHDQAWLRDSVKVKVARRGDEARFRVSSVGVGHSLPSGDLFRNMTLEVHGAEDWRVVARFGRDFEVTADEATGEVTKQLVGDTSLQPGETREIRAPASKGDRWRLRYHYGSDVDEQRGLLDVESIVIVLAEGEV